MPRFCHFVPTALVVVAYRLQLIFDSLAVLLVTTNNTVEYAVSKIVVVEISHSPTLSILDVSNSFMKRFGLD